MTGHFFCVGVPEELEFKSYGQEGKELAKWKFGFQRFQTFSESSIEVLRNTSGLDTHPQWRVREVARPAETLRFFGFMLVAEAPSLLAALIRIAQA